MGLVLTILSQIFIIKIIVLLFFSRIPEQNLPKTIHTVERYLAVFRWLLQHVGSD